MALAGDVKAPGYKEADALLPEAAHSAGQRVYSLLCDQAV
jgi:hypothetical protein